MLKDEDKSIGLVIPIYNVEKYLEECLESIANQTISFDEVILVNDGSTDNSREICERYCQRYDYFRLINQNNQGQASARNNGLHYIKSDYVFFIDSDDYIATNAREIIQQQFIQADLDILFFSSEVQFDIELEDKRNIYIRTDGLCNRLMKGMEFLERSFPTHYIVSPCLAVYQNKFLLDNNILFPEGLYYEDNLFALQCMCQAEKIMCIPDRLYIRRYREDSVTTSKVTAKKARDMVSVHKLMWQYIAQIVKPQTLNFWKGYISYGVVATFSMLQEFSDEVLRMKYEEDFIRSIFGCGWVMEDRGLTIEVLCMRLLIYNKISQIGIDRFSSIKGMPCTAKEIEEIAHECSKGIRQILDDKLKRILIPNSSRRIVIYGVGKHTEYLLKYIRQYHGNTLGELYFAVTEKDHLKFMDNRMIEIHMHPETIDQFVVSSQIYQDSMVKLLKANGIEDERIVLLYDETSVFDLVNIVPILLAS